MSVSKGVADRLAGVPLFKGLNRSELEAVLRSSDEVDHAAGRPIVREGTSGVGFHLILDGTATVSQGDRSLRSLGPGDYFGEIALIDGEPRSASVTADTPVRTLSVASWNFRPLLEEHPRITVKLLLEMCRRLREMEGQAQQI